MNEQFIYDFRTGCGNSAKFVRFFDMGFSFKIEINSKYEPILNCFENYNACDQK